MESIERMAPPSQLELDGSDTYIVTMREFLDKPRIARDFQDLKADAQRLDSIGREGDLLKAGAALSAVLEAVALTVFTTMMVWLGILVLSFTKSRHVSAADRRARNLRRRADRKAVQEAELGRKLAAARSEFLADAQLFSFRTFHNDARRNQFLEYVRAELSR